MIFSVGNADVIADITSVRQFLTFSVMPSLSIMITYENVGYEANLHIEWDEHTYAPACKKIFARSINHFGSLVPADSNSSIEASPPAPHL